MVSVPKSYSEWINCFELYKKEEFEDEVIKVIKEGRISWQSGVAERFTKSLFDIINYKIEVITNKLNKKITGSLSNVELERILVQTRNSLSRLMVFTTIDSIPSEVRDNIRKYITDSADTIQSSLVDSAKRDSSGFLLKLVNNNAVNKFSNINCENAKEKEDKHIEEKEERPNYSSRRRILI